jgi:hypothetical protein
LVCSWHYLGFLIEADEQDEPAAGADAADGAAA